MFQRLIVFLAFCVLTCGPAFGQARTSDSFTYQGLLHRDAGAFEGEAELMLRFFDQAEAGNLLGSHGVTASVVGGLFAVDVPLSVFGDAAGPEDAWVEISVVDGPDEFVLAPRQAVRSAPVAARSLSTRGVSVDEQGRVGLGTDAPTHALHASTGDNLALMIESSSPVGTWLNMHNTSKGGRFWQLISTGESDGEGAGNLLIGHGAEPNSHGTVMTLKPNGRVGIGQPNPRGPLDVGGTIYSDGLRMETDSLPILLSAQGVTRDANSGSGNGLVVLPNGGGGIRAASLFTSFTVRGQFPEPALFRAELSDGTTRFIVDALGRVGINSLASSSTTLYVQNAANRENALWVVNPTFGTLLRVSSSGTLSVGGAKLFDIEHPMDPDMRLRHAVVESPEYGTQYRGRAVIGPDGRAEVELPSYFQALNTNAQYQLTCIGGFAPVYIESEVSDNRFVIAGGQEGLRVDWVVTAVRDDPWVHENPLEVEGP
ncbi:MAG: hypothetical protein EA419_08890 [Wenzhouxiangella sp.]|nr:MAG: hypothetical protein EA419_08890 [Wenzhouxiangella sp.]